MKLSLYCRLREKVRFSAFFCEFFLPFLVLCNPHTCNHHPVENIHLHPILLSSHISNISWVYKQADSPVSQNYIHSCHTIHTFPFERILCIDDSLSSSRNAPLRGGMHKAYISDDFCCNYSWQMKRLHIYAHHHKSIGHNNLSLSDSSFYHKGHNVVYEPSYFCGIQLSQSLSSSFFAGSIAAMPGSGFVF